MVTLFKTRLILTILCCAHTAYLCGSQNGQRLSPYTALTCWFLKPRYIVFTARYRLSLRVLNINPSNPSAHYMYHQFNIQILRSAHTVYLCLLCAFENKKRLFPYEALSDWFYNRDILFIARHEMNCYSCFGIVLFSVPTRLGLLVADPLRRRPVFDQKSVHLRFVADKGAQ